MIENFNLGLNSVSRDEMQTKHPFGEKGYGLQDPAAGPQRNRQSLSCLISCCSLCLTLLYAFDSPRRTYDDCNQCFLSVTPFKEQTLLFCCCNPRRVFLLHCQPYSTLQEIVCVSGYGSQWHNNACMCLSVHEYQWYFICSSTLNCTEFMYVCAFHDMKQFLVRFFNTDVWLYTFLLCGAGHRWLWCNLFSLLLIT